VKILIVDDEPNVVELVDYNLKLNGFTTDTAFDGRTAMQKIKEGSYDLVILDQMLPLVSGIEVLKSIREHKDLNTTPVLMLTAKSEEGDVVQALNFGADDYITKPFRVHEMIARVKSILRRSSTSSSGGAAYKFADFEINEDRFEVLVSGKPVRFTTKEFRLLLFMIQNPNRVIRREQLLNDVWGYDYLGESRTVDVHVLNVRKKIEPNPKNPKYLVTIIGEGYKFIQEH
jgi:Response regulators consisting of a CheY-like receiver domain and a winged-helix DNA-binding domain